MFSRLYFSLAQNNLVVLGNFYHHRNLKFNMLPIYITVNP